MPIVDVEIVGGGEETGLAQALADDVGHVFEAQPGRVWVRLRSLEASRYAENGAAAPRPVFVCVLAFAPPEGEAMDDLVARLTEAVARRTGRPPENVHVLFEPAARGRVAFGGRLVR